MSECSLLVIEGVDAKHLHGRETQIGEQAGIKFIKLLSKKYGEVRLRGFQGARIVVGRMDGENGKLTRSVEWSQKRNGEAIMCARSLVFKEDKESGEFVAFCPDTEYNRRSLTAAFDPVSEWSIVDEKAAAEIRVDYEAGAKLVKEKKTKDEVISSLAGDAKKDKEELERLRKENEELRKRQTVVITAEKMAAIRTQVKAEVLEEKKDLIEAMKLKSKQYWVTSEYKEQIEALIDQRTSERANVAPEPSKHDQF